MAIPLAKACSPRLGVVTVTFNAADFLRPFMECCLTQTLADFELLVIDNASTDGTLHVVSGMVDPRVSLIRNERNIGYAAACNQGVRYFMDRGIDDILFINNDTEFSPGLFESLRDVRARYDADAITPRIAYADDTSINWFAGGRYSFWKGFQAEHIGIGHRHDPADTRPRLIPVASGCCVMFKTSTFDRVGVFDENYFVYFEDTDYFMRMQRHGLRLLYAPGISIAHKVSLSTGGTKSDFYIRYYHRNQLYFLRKYFSPPVVFVQFVLIWLKATFYLFMREDTLRQYLLRLSSMFEGLRIPVQSKVHVNCSC